jgi:hypothetical protein
VQLRAAVLRQHVCKLDKSLALKIDQPPALLASPLSLRRSTLGDLREHGG